jgi:two-component system sensor histidine kinase KdpD
MARTPQGDEDQNAIQSARRLSELREIALLFAADVVDRQLELYLHRSGLDGQTFGVQEHIMVCVTPRANARPMIESGRRNADRFHGELIVSYVSQPNLTLEDQAALKQNLDVARANHADVQILEGEDPVAVLLDFARERKITQLFLGHSLQEKWWHSFTGTHVDRLIRGARGMDVRVFPH